MLAFSRKRMCPFEDNSLFKQKEKLQITIFINLLDHKQFEQIYNVINNTLQQFPRELAISISEFATGTWQKCNECNNNIPILHNDEEIRSALLIGPLEIGSIDYKRQSNWQSCTDISILGYMFNYDNNICTCQSCLREWTCNKTVCCGNVIQYEQEMIQCEGQHASPVHISICNSDCECNEQYICEVCKKTYCSMCKDVMKDCQVCFNIVCPSCYRVEDNLNKCDYCKGLIIIITDEQWNEMLDPVYERNIRMINSS